MRNVNAGPQPGDKTWDKIQARKRALAAEAAPEAAPEEAIDVTAEAEKNKDEELDATLNEWRQHLVDKKLIDEYGEPKMVQAKDARGELVRDRRGEVKMVNAAQAYAAENNLDQRYLDQVLEKQVEASNEELDKLGDELFEEGYMTKTGNKFEVPIVEIMKEKNIDATKLEKIAARAKVRHAPVRMAA